MVYLANSFSFQMCNGTNRGKINFEVVPASDVVLLLENNHFISAVGHEETAKFLSDLLGIYIPYNRISIRLDNHDVLIVAQYINGRITDGIKLTPDSFKFYKVTLERSDANV